MAIKDFLGNFYVNGYKWMIIVPAVIFIIALLLAFGVPKSIDLKGGTNLTIHSGTTASEQEIKDYLAQEYSLQDISIKKINSLSGSFIEIEYITPQDLITLKSEITTIKTLVSDNKEHAKQLALDFLEKKGQNRYEWESKTVEELAKQMDVIYNNYKNNKTNVILSGLNAKFGMDTTEVDLREVGASLGETFYKIVIKLFIMSIILVMIVIFLFFREFIPSVAVVLAGIMDLIGAMAGMALFNVPLSLVTLPALLMLIGYSVDTDILLTTKLLKRKEGNLRERAGDAMKTGLTMTFAAIGAICVMLLFAKLYNIQVIVNISIVLVCGLVVDLFATWFMNAPILIWYLEHRNKSKKEVR